MTSQASSPNPCSQPLLFEELASRKVVADFSGGHLSSDGGLLLLRELDSSLGLTRSLATCFRDARQPLFVEHSLCELVAQRVLGLAAGYEDLIHPH
jgi:Transposase DDE domain group 1